MTSLDQAKHDTECNQSDLQSLCREMDNPSFNSSNDRLWPAILRACWNNETSLRRNVLSRPLNLLWCHHGRRQYSRLCRLEPFGQLAAFSGRSARNRLAEPSQAGLPSGPFHETVVRVERRVTGSIAWEGRPRHDLPVLPGKGRLRRLTDQHRAIAN